MQNIATKVDGSSTLTAAEFNQIPDELEGLISSSGQTLSGADVAQVGKAVAIYAGLGDFYTDGGAADAYVLSATGTQKVPSTYIAGMRVRFKPGNTNTGASTINVAGLGIKTIKQADGASALSAAALTADRDIELVYDGTYFRQVSVGAGATTTNTSQPADGRLTLSSGIPATVSDVTAATTLYYTPAIGNRIAVYNGSGWDTITFSQISIAVPATTSTMYDVFVYSSGGTATLELAAWTNDTTRATALVRQDGVLCKTGTLTRRYVGSFRTTTSSGQTEDSYKRRFVYNYHNQVRRSLYGSVPVSSWSYTNTTLRAINANTTVGEGRVEVVIGEPNGQQVGVRYSTSSYNASASDRVVAIGLNSTTTRCATHTGGLSSTTTFGANICTASPTVAAGYSYLQALEGGVAAGTTVWQGDVDYTGISGELLG